MLRNRLQSKERKLLYFCIVLLTRKADPMRSPRFPAAKCTKLHIYNKTSFSIIIIHVKLFFQSLSNWVFHKSHQNNIQSKVPQWNISKIIYSLLRQLAILLKLCLHCAHVSYTKWVHGLKEILSYRYNVNAWITSAQCINSAAGPGPCVGGLVPVGEGVRLLTIEQEIQYLLGIEISNLFWVLLTTVMIFIYRKS